MIKNKIEWFKIWNYWRKGNSNCLIHKIFVLFKIIKSPTLNKGYIEYILKKKKKYENTKKRIILNESNIKRL